MKPAVFIGADHGGFEYKNQIREHLIHQGYQVEDVGAETLDPADDYPQFAYAVATKILGEEGSVFGILVCRGGQGMAMAANRVAGIRAAVAWSPEVAQKTREDNNANVLCLPGDMIDIDTSLDIVDTFIKEPFSNEERHVRRLGQIEDLFG
ncbi:MAG TPA: RpiB/LacA/LacB family sugar-phosphate isomerase [Candidatus Saccharimonadia bacterium]